MWVHQKCGCITRCRRMYNSRPGVSLDLRILTHYSPVCLISTALWTFHTASKNFWTFTMYRQSFQQSPTPTGYGKDIWDCKSRNHRGSCGDPNGRWGKWYGHRAKINLNLHWLSLPTTFLVNVWSLVKEMDLWGPREEDCTFILIKLGMQTLL